MKQFVTVALVAVLLLAVAPSARANEEHPKVENGIADHTKDGTDAGAAAREEDTFAYGGFSTAERKALESQQESHEFQAEVGRLMDIIIHSLYSNRDIFLRELISNASDALDKIRFLSLTDKSLLGTGETADLEIRIRADKTLKTLTIRDRGIGMTKEELVKNLGTVAKSGTTQFVEAAMKGGAEALNLIGQFGVGFYSVYLVADEVIVVSKSNDSDKQFVWESKAQGTFTVAEDPRGNTLGRGTEVVLHLKEDALEFLEQDKLEKVSAKYSEFINFPIFLHTSKQVSKEVPVEEEPVEEVPAEEKTEGEGEGEEEVDVSEDEEAAPEPAKPKTKTIQETVEEWKLLNEHKPLWTRKPDDVSDEEYKNFFKALTKDTKDPITWSHFNAEGEVQFKSLLYIPSEAPHDLYDKYYGKSTALRLYVRRVLIQDEFDDLLPRYLNFIKGVIDSDDLPLNVNRETLQRHKILKVIGKKLTKKAIDLLTKLAKDSEKEEEDAKDGEEATETPKPEGDHDYDKFWKAFGKSVRLGVIEDSRNKEKLTRLVRFFSSESKGTKLISLETYVERMKPSQEFIYYIAGSGVKEVESSPFLEKLRKKGYEVLYLIEPLDEYCIQAINEFEGKKLMSVTKEGLKLSKAETKRHEEQGKVFEEEFKPLVSYLKTAYGDKVEKIVISTRLTTSPAVLVTGQYGWSANMERIMKAQALSDTSRQMYMVSKKTMEINPRHPIIKELKNRVEAEGGAEDEGVKDLSALLLDSAMITSGFQVEETADFATRINRVMKLSLQLDPNAEAEEEEDVVEESETPAQEDGEAEAEESVDADDDEAAKHAHHDEL